MMSGMLSTTITLSLLFVPPDPVRPPPDQVCVEVPPAPELMSVAPFEISTIDGARNWGATATYRLSSADIGEAYFAINSDGSGEAQLMIDGDIIVHTAIALDAATGQPVVTTWYPATIEQPPELIAEMVRVDLPIIVAEGIPQEFKCSDWGKKVTRVASLLFRATSYAASGACCAATAPSIVGCAICAGAIGLTGDEIGDLIDEHCD
jgi:hypothetical protein